MDYNRYCTRRVRPPKPGSYFEQRRAARRKKIILFCLLAAAVGLLMGGAYAFRLLCERNYADGLRYLEQENYTAAEEKFDHSHGWRDADTLRTYSWYAAMYQNKSTYVSGEGMLELFHLRYDTQWQSDIDALAKRIERYYQASLRQSAYSSSSKSSSSSSTSSSKKSSSSSSKRSSLPSGSTTTKKNTGTYHYSGTYNSKHGQTFNYGGGGTHSTLRDDYDNPEDLYEDNKDWYEDEDEAWDEYYDD